jgi:hypothetical protein
MSVVSRIRFIAAVLHLAACSEPGAQQDVPPDDTTRQATTPPSESVATMTSPRDSVLAKCGGSLTREDRTICPGYRVGAITIASTIDGLKQIYGADAVRPADIYLGEGETAPGAIVKASATDSVSVAWSSRGGVDFVEIETDGWRTPEGIGLGSTLEEIEDAYGKVRVYGFGFDYAGTLELPDIPQTKGLLIRTRPSVTEPVENGVTGVRRHEKDVPRASDDPSVRLFKPVVRAIYLRFREPGAN